jgi:glutaredoxin 3
MNVVIWSRANCPYCVSAKEILRDFNIPFTEKVLDRDFTREFLLETYPTAKTFPVVVVDGFYIGGYNQLSQKLNEEKSSTQRLLNEQVM